MRWTTLTGPARRPERKQVQVEQGKKMIFNRTLSNIARWATVSASISCVISCSSAGDKRIAVGQIVTTPAQEGISRLPVINDTYRIGPLDELRITVFREPDLSANDLPVDISGMIALPLLGAVKATGLTANELAQIISSRLGQRYLRNPQVSVSITKATNFTVAVNGQVKKPGVFPIPGRISLVQAIALAEGTTDFAKSNEVYLFREAGEKTYIARFDVKAIERGRSPNPQLQQNDLVVVGTSSAAKVTKDVLTLFPGLAGILVQVVR